MIGGRVTDEESHKLDVVDGKGSDPIHGKDVHNNRRL